MDQTPETTNPTPETAAGAAGGKPKLKLPGVKLPALKLPAIKLPAFGPVLAKLPRPRLAMPDRAALDPRHWRVGKSVLPDLWLAVGAASLVLSILYVVMGPAREQVRMRSAEVATRNNAATLQLAAETYAAANLGRYPRDVRELLPYLPGGEAPRNPFSGDPVMFRAAGGDLTWRTQAGGDYVIEAWGPGPARPSRLVTLRGRAPAQAH